MHKHQATLEWNEKRSSLRGIGMVQYCYSLCHAQSMVKLYYASVVYWCCTVFARVHRITLRYKSHTPWYICYLMRGRSKVPPRATYSMLHSEVLKSCTCTRKPCKYIHIYQANYTNSIVPCSPRLLVTTARSSHYTRVATVYDLHALLE